MSNTPVILATYTVKKIPLHIFIAYTGFCSPSKVYVVYKKGDKIVANWQQIPAEKPPVK